MVFILARALSRSAAFRCIAQIKSEELNIKQSSPKRGEPPRKSRQKRAATATIPTRHSKGLATSKVRKGGYGLGVNDPSAGSPTETLLRLLLPLNDKV